MGLNILGVGAIAMAMLLVGVLYVRLRRSEARRADVEALLREQHEILELGHKIVCDLDGRIRSWYSGAEQLYGWSKREAMGRLAHELLHTEFPEPLRDIQTRLLETGRWDGELVHRRRDGRKIVVESHWVLYRDGDRPPVVLEVNNDITERRQANARLRAIVESSPSGMVMADQHGAIVLVNREIERLFGYTSDELMGQTIDMLVPRRLQAVHATVRSAFMTRPEARAIGHRRDLLALRKDGSEVAVEIGLSPVETDEGAFVLASVVDISARKRAESELRRSNEELERFAYVASHDLQEPLRMVGNYVQLLAKRYRGRLDADADDFIGFAVDGAVRMQRLIEDLLAYSRVSTRGSEFEAVDTGAVLANTLATLALAIEDAGVQITSDTLPVVSGDKGQLGHVFQNLIGNAVKFRGPSPAVHISAARQDEFWLFAIRDNGIGIEPQYFDRIFVIFQRLHGRETYPGTGIGLAITKRIIERHGGRIWVESSPGLGTTFFFTLPAERRSS